MQLVRVYRIEKEQGCENVLSETNSSLEYYLERNRIWIGDERWMRDEG